MSRDDALTRREWMARAARAGATLAVAGGAAFALHDDRLPRVRGSGTDGAAGLADWSLRDGGPALSIVTGRDRRRTVGRALQSLGGIERFVRPGDRVLLKPNAGFATPAELGATTHPDLVNELVRLCLAAGARSVAVTDNPVGDPETCFGLSGIADAAREAGARIVLPREAMFRNLTVPGSALLRDWPVLAGPLDGIDRVIGVCPVKDHVRSVATMTLKNWYGLLGGRRNLFHQRISEIVRDLALLVRPTLVVLDGTATMRRNGPTGGSVEDLEATNTMIVATDPVAADAFGASLLGRRPADVPWLAMAAAAGAGTADWESLSPRRDSVDS